MQGAFIHRDVWLLKLQEQISVTLDVGFVEILGANF